ncbi:MAG: NTP transferase domain-containing protein [Deltaproteobacteria bacterium]|nr:NTP transferase domain-containing protein [Deltaproteobacteria bacterium]
MKRDEQHLWGIVLAAGEGTRAREFLRRLCGGHGIKQFCVITGQRSMLQHTLARVERLIPRERILVVVSRDHRDEVRQQLAHWPTHNVIFQPANRDTGPGILLPLMHVTRRDPEATVAVFPSDHFIKDEKRFVETAARAVAEVSGFPRELLLLGMTPDRVEDGYGWIEPASAEAGQESSAVRKFWEKPSPADARALMARGALWNTFVFVAQSATLWRMFRRAAPDICNMFDTIRPMLSSPYATLLTAHVYETMPSLNFSSGVCESLASSLRVLPVPECGWSDWGSAERILASLRQIGRLKEYSTRLTQRQAAA